MNASVKINKVLRAALNHAVHQQREWSVRNSDD